MPTLPSLMKCLLKAAVRNAGRPFGLDFVGAIVADAWDNWDNNKKLAEKLKELEGIAQTRFDEFLNSLQSSLKEAEAEEGSVKLTPEKREEIITLMAQVPGQIQRAFRRPTDPDGKTAPADTVLRTAADLNFIFPTELPRYRPGDRPYPNYELIKPLGTGGFSYVWLAKEVNLNQQYVMKFGFSVEQLRERYGAIVKPDANPLKHEAAVQAKLAEANCREGIVLPLASFLNAEPSCLIYEYMPDGDLSGYISFLHSSNFPVAKIHSFAHRIILLLAKYLSKAHAADVVHRDLKPANILFKRDASGELIPMLADFGIGGFAHRNKINTNGTTAGYTGYQTTMMLSSHSPVYASPQQIRMEEPNPADDIYALGVLGYQLLSGDKLPGMLAIPSDWTTELQSKSVPEGYIRLIGQCLSPKREKRIANAGELHRMLQLEFEKHDVAYQARMKQEAIEKEARAAEEIKRRDQLQHEQVRDKEEAARQAEIERAKQQRAAINQKLMITAKEWTLPLSLSFGIGAVLGLLLGLSVGIAFEIFTDKGPISKDFNFTAIFTRCFFCTSAVLAIWAITALILCDDDETGYALLATLLGVFSIALGCLIIACAHSLTHDYVMIGIVSSIGGGIGALGFSPIIIKKLSISGYSGDFLGDDKQIRIGVLANCTICGAICYAPLGVVWVLAGFVLGAMFGGLCIAIFQKD